MDAGVPFSGHTHDPLIFSSKLTDMDTFQQCLPPLHPFCSTLHSNITKEERAALDKLRKEPSILIWPVDKGKSTVILDKDKFSTDVKRMLNDECTYKILPTDPMLKYKKRPIGLLKRLQDNKKIT